MAEELRTVHDVAKQLHVDDATVRRWIEEGHLEAIALPQRGTRNFYRIKQAAVDKIIEQDPIPPRRKRVVPG